MQNMNISSNLTAAANQNGQVQTTAEATPRTNLKEHAKSNLNFGLNLVDNLDFESENSKILKRIIAAKAILCCDLKKVDEELPTTQRIAPTVPSIMFGKL